LYNGLSRAKIAKRENSRNYLYAKIFSLFILTLSKSFFEVFGIGVITRSDSDHIIVTLGLDPRVYFLDCRIKSGNDSKKKKSGNDSKKKKSGNDRKKRARI